MSDLRRGPNFRFRPIADIGQPLHSNLVHGLSYIRVRWLHSFPDEPIELWSELDATRFEVRKIEIWADGRIGYAVAKQEVGGTQLGPAPMPPIAEIASDPQFKPEEVSASAFDEVWAKRVR